MPVHDKDIAVEKNKEEDYRTVRQILDGDTSQFRVLEKKYKKIIVHLIRKMIRNEDDVEDLTQETFIKAYNALNRFQFGYTFSSWLYKIASNTCIDFMRKKRFQTVSLSQPINGDDEQVFEIADNDYKADSNVISEERKQAILGAIDHLPENYKTIIRLRHDEELDYAQISKILEIPIGTVKAHLFRARKILLGELQNKKYLFTDN